MALVPDSARDDVAPLVRLMLDRFVLAMRRDGSTAPPSWQELRQAESLARAWSDPHLLDAEQVRDWLEECPHVTPDVALELTLRGVTPREAAERLAHGRRSRTPLWSLVQFRELSADEAVARLRG